MYHHMHKPRVYRSTDHAELSPNLAPRVRLKLDYAAWHSRLEGASGAAVGPGFLPHVIATRFVSEAVRPERQAA